MSRNYKFKLNLIRNRAFLTQEISQKGSNETAILDLSRMMASTSINGVLLRNILIDKLNIKQDESYEDIDESINKGLLVKGDFKLNAIFIIFKEYLFDDITDTEIKDILAIKFTKIAYQKGLFHVLGNSLTSKESVGHKGYFPQTDSIFNIYKNKGEDGFYIDEECKVTSLNQ